MKNTRNKNVKGVLAITILFSLIILYYIGTKSSVRMFESNTTEIRDISEYTNPVNNYTVLFQSLGDPEFPFGRTKVRITLFDENNLEVDSLENYISDDGSSARESNIDIQWFDNYVKITFIGREQEDEIRNIYFK